VLGSIAAKRWFFLGLSFAIFALDQASKYPFRASWTLGQSKPFLPVLSFTYVQNTGSLFGLFQGNAFVLGLVSLSVAMGICWYAWNLPKDSGKLPYITLGFLLGGALGNMLDRLLFGFVVDFMDIQWMGRNIWPVFNVADIAVDVAIGLFIIMAIFEPKESQPVLDSATGSVKLNSDLVEFDSEPETEFESESDFERPGLIEDSSTFAAAEYESSQTYSEPDTSVVYSDSDSSSAYSDSDTGSASDSNYE
jgi:signal peptidase II